ncbi:MAG: hypothetical protein EOO43_06860 [Flavobacterium sp.]|nr:MAG: hypothetical protein EOO43_06860 [Flavobacterium sp.]
MNDFFSIIGTIASIGSIPLSVYLYIKSKENNIDKVKREIVRILSYQIGDRRQLTTFEIQTVINSKTRDFKIENSKITVNEIIEDLVSETISNPLLDKGIKEIILQELKSIYFKSELLLTIDNLERDTRPDKYHAIDDSKIEAEIKKIINTRKDLIEKHKELVKNENQQSSLVSNYFGLIATAMTLLIAILSLIGKQNYDSLNDTISEFFEKNDFYIGLVGSGVTALLTGLFTYLTWKFRSEKKK